MNRREDSPKILVITIWAPPMIGGPKNLYNLFSQFPRDSYVILTSAYAIDPLSAATGTWLPGEYVYFDRKDGDRPPAEESSAGERDRVSVKGRMCILIQRIPLFGHALLDAMSLLLNLPRIIRLARKVIREERMTRLLGISDGGVALLGTYLVHKISGLSYSLYLFDLYRGNRLTCFTPGRCAHSRTPADPERRDGHRNQRGNGGVCSPTVRGFVPPGNRAQLRFSRGL